MGLIPPIFAILFPHLVPGAGVTIVLTERLLLQLTSGGAPEATVKIVVTQPSTVQVTIRDSTITVQLAVPPPLVTIIVSVPTRVNIEISGRIDSTVVVRDYPIPLATVTITPSTLTNIILVDGPGVITNVLYPNAA